MDHESNLPNAADFARIEDQLFTRISLRHRRQVVQHRLLAVAAVLVLAGAGVAAGSVVNSEQQRTVAYCYSGSTTDSPMTQLALPNQSHRGGNPSAGVTRERVANALFICGAAWRGGVFNTTSSSGPFAVPKLQVCVRDDLAVSVFRKPKGGQSADTFCENLGLSAP